MANRRSGADRRALDDNARVLPHDLEAERSILGAILLHNEALHVVIDAIQPDDFFRHAHRGIYVAMLDLAEAGAAIDLITLRAELGRTDALTDAGGPAYIAALVDGVPRSTNVTHYAAIVREKSRLRRGILAATRLLARAYEEEDSAGELLAAAAEDFFALGGEAARGRPVPLQDIVGVAMDAIQRAHEAGSAVTGLPTGFIDLDEMLAGLQPEDLVIIAARTSQGKTSLAMNVARHVGKSETVLIFSLEMSKAQLFLRLLAGEARIDSQRLRCGALSERDWPKLSEAISRLGETKVFVDDTPGLGVLEVRARARAIRAVHGLKLVVVDYLQLMHGRGKFDNRTQEIGTISRGLKGVAKELGVPVVALSQLNRAPEQRKNKRPQLSDLRESGDIENDADVVLLLYRPEEEEHTNIAEVIVAKQRNGPTGTVRLAFLKEITKFENLARSA